MHENVLPAPVRSDKTVAFRGVVELYGPGLLNQWSPGTARRRPVRPRALCRFFCRRAAVDSEHFGDLHSLLPWTCPNLEGSAGIDPAPSDKIAYRFMHRVRHLEARGPDPVKSETLPEEVWFADDSPVEETGIRTLGPP
jgi:hypothetical protein